jgi:subtilisin family serine protease
MSGTSMSSPAVTGIVALMLEANPHLTTAEVCDIIRSTSRNDDKTGPLHANDSVSVRWGWGKVDAINAVNAAYDRLSIEEAAKIRPALVVAPNPAANVVTVLTGSNKPETLEIFSIDGRMVQKTTITSSATIDISELDKGVYIMRVQDRAGVRTAKVVKQ